jgi:hypothetical protein
VTDTPRRVRLAVLLGCLVVALATAWYAGARSGSVPSPPQAAVGSVRLGPEPGADVDGYLARLPVELPPPGLRTLALVQFAAEVTVAEALAAVEGAEPVTAVFRVPLPRVQTALRFEPLDPGVPPATALGTARERAQLAAGSDAHRLSGATQRAAGRPAAVAAAEAAALAAPGCRCLLALLARGDREVLTVLARRPGVRAVHAAPPGTVPVELALAPLLPGQEVRADPLPDDGPVPAPGGQ